VLVASAAVPQLASMIWGAAGLVANIGSEGAHLFEVARSLGVPAVLGVEVEGARDRIVAVNGDAGTVSVLDPGAGTRERAHAGDEISIERRLG
jgi:phosphoenolpyruvate-protein kinase (PTS system EI component)